MEYSPPPLTSSPHSSPEAFCSESPILEYTQPILVEVNRRSHRYNYEQPYAIVASMMDAQNSLPPLGTTTSSPGWTTSTALQPLPALSLPNILSAGSDPFAHYESNLDSTYSHDMYPSQYSHGLMVSNNSPSIVGTPCCYPDPVRRYRSFYLRILSPIPRIKIRNIINYVKIITVPVNYNGYFYDNIISGYVIKLLSIK